MALIRCLGEAHGERFAAYHGDAVDVVRQFPDKRIGLSVYSPPFSNLFIYSDSVADMGNSGNDEEFIEHYGFLLRELYRVTMPGRLSAVHASDLPLQKWRDGVIGIRDLSGAIIRAHEAAGWVLASRITIWKSPVVEMTRTKALGLLYKQLRKDSCRSRAGMADYLLVFRKEGENLSPVTHTPDSFPLAQWQEWASPVWMTVDQTNVLNGATARAAEDERHICPLQLDVIDRALILWSNPDDIVLSPFMGIGSEGVRALAFQRRFIGVELKDSYFQQAVRCLGADDRQMCLDDRAPECRGAAQGEGSMLKRIVTGLVVCSLLVFGSVPAPAQTADPVGLIASAAIVPFWNSGATFTVFEVTSLGNNAQMHSFFFSATCERVFSIPFAMTEHDADIVFSQDLGLSFNGLMLLARSVDNISPIALESPITLRAHRVDLLADVIAVVDPISARNAEDPTRTWNPLRSGASTVTLPGLATRWFFVCPKNNLPVDLGAGIPPLPPGPNLVRMRVFDLEEEPILDIQVPCNCLTEIAPASLHPVFLTESRYVELVSVLGVLPIDNPPSFVLYRQLRPGGAGEDFGRAPGMSAATLFTGTPQVGAR